MQLTTFIWGGQFLKVESGATTKCGYKDAKKAMLWMVFAKVKHNKNSATSKDVEKRGNQRKHTKTHFMCDHMCLFGSQEIQAFKLVGKGYVKMW